MNNNDTYMSLGYIIPTIRRGAGCPYCSRLAVLSRTLFRIVTGHILPTLKMPLPFFDAMSVHYAIIQPFRGPSLISHLRATLAPPAHKIITPATRASQIPDNNLVLSETVC